MITLLGKRWKINDRVKYTSIKDTLLKYRGVKDKDSFLNPKYADLQDPFLMKDMEKTVARIEKSKEKNEKIIIYGDYDVDGVVSATLLKDILNKFGLTNIEVVLPHRVDDGYGLNTKYLKKFVDCGVSLLFTVDNGTAAIIEIDKANKLGIDVIIMDHHQPHEILPKAFLLNPLRKDCNYPDKNLCGVGIVFKFLQAMSIKHPDIFTEGFVKWKLDIVALGTVADCAKLIGENRIFVHYGLQVLKQTQRSGLKHLMRFSEIDPIRVSESDIGFKIGPRLNAAGRISEAKKAFTVLSSARESEIVSSAFELQEINNKRRDMTNDMMLAAYAKIDTSKNYIFIYQEDWHAGIIGLVAGNLAREFDKPAFILCMTPDGIVGSVRAPECELDIMNVIKANSELFLRYGGHQKAAGFLLEKSKVEKLDQGLNLFFKKIDKELLKSVLNIDMCITPSEIHKELMSEIDKVSPFGIGNMEPVFVLKSMKINNVIGIGKNKDHLRFNIEQNSTKFKCVGFGLGKYIDIIEKSSKDQLADIVFTLQKNIWQGRYSIDLRIVDIMFNE